MRLLIPLLTLTACTDYSLRNWGHNDEVPDADDAKDTAIWGDTCPADDKVYPAYQVSSLTAGCQETEPLPDLTVVPSAWCEVDCDEDRLVVWVQVGNKGRTPATGVRLYLYALLDGERELVEVRELDQPVADGWYSDSMAFDLVGLEVDDWAAVTFRVEGDQTDCEQVNDELNVVGPFCELLR
ncbi:MAG: hypothetical protein JXX28_00200 [Deltaproteobacteria bacterium]|nr:hypothetical protein [Deltaproteobacteria bacterium]